MANCYRPGSKNIRLRRSVSGRKYTLKAKVPGAGYVLDNGAGNCWSVDQVQFEMSFTKANKDVEFEVSARLNHPNPAKWKGTVELRFALMDGRERQLYTVPFAVAMKCSDANSRTQKFKKVDNNAAQNVTFVRLVDDRAGASPCGG